MGELTAHRRARIGALTAACLVTALAVAGCTAGGDAGGCTAGGDAGGKKTASPSTGSPNSATTPPQRAEHIDGETVTKAPQIVDGKAIVSVASVRGNRELPLDGGVRSGPVSIAVNCEGKGTLTVELTPVGLSFPLECVAGEVSSTYNQIALKKARKDATVRVTASSGVRWSLSVGQ
ncbi:hypothetical protein GCM10022403_062410 [Streptomyces coacervatus]|uniref:Lipoprotein n=1 Tax=Streptomyces coacervatus TaxID=647381 RepID=A0ABP7IK92_9ACTN|nr:hypothetical protein [Streptomyces coacervatus]MDF2273041.1 hypothetical protein [Streptomyces coacervatus]